MKYPRTREWDKLRHSQGSMGIYGKTTDFLITRNPNNRRRLRFCGGVSKEPKIKNYIVSAIGHVYIIGFCGGGHCTVLSSRVVDAIKRGLSRQSDEHKCVGNKLIYHRQGPSWK